MKKNRFSILLTMALFVAMPFVSKSQKTGNIVEIFGRDRVETTDEGVVAHDFTKGLALRYAIRPGMLSGYQDILFWQIATDRFRRPVAGEYLDDMYGPPNLKAKLQWESVEVDTSGYFTGDLNRAYVYTEFDSPEEKIALLDASGHTRVYINGLPHEGDHYDYRHTLIPFKLKKGLNTFIYTYGRFGRLCSKIVIPHKEVMFSGRDLTLPSLIKGETDAKWGAVRIINVGEAFQKGLSIECVLATGEKQTHSTDFIMPMTVHKVKFKIPAMKAGYTKETMVATLVLRDADGAEIDRMDISLNVREAGKHHERTFISSIDGSVQYFSVVPSTSPSPKQAFVLSVHGASVEATNQARAYKQKDWAHIVAPTNRRPFGFNWEEWGRVDALEVLKQGLALFDTDPQRTYLTGHSMGGHGTWYLGATYPDKWAAIAPAAGYPDIIGYRRTGTDSAMIANPHFAMLERGAMAGRVLNIMRNYLQSGVYVLHGSADEVVPVEQARMMRENLGKFHDNFSYYEYPGGTHWYGDHSMDWPPLFDFLKQNTIPLAKDVTNLEFHTASPGVSASNYWITVNQQEKQNINSSANLRLANDTIDIQLLNVESITLHLSMLELKKPPVLRIGDQILSPGNTDDIILKKSGGVWQPVPSISYAEKYPQRYGGFKSAFLNNVVLVYATRGTEEENQWYENRARYDAETFLYLGNGSFDVIPDVEFSPEKYADRNVIMYGNAANNRAWDMLLNHCPVRVNNGSINFGSRELKGNDLGALFVYPRADSNTASVGVVSGTGTQGMKATYTNDYFSGITGYPDLLIFNVDMVRDGLKAMKISGFFGNDWSIDGGDFVISQ